MFVDTTLVKKLAQFKATSKCQRIMFASMSHEFRTPLNSINTALIFLDNWINTFYDEKQRPGKRKSSKDLK
jgi:signal transduction histidine kinase